MIGFGKSFIELSTRERAIALLDAGTARELLGPFDRIESPWLEMQGVVPESDDGTVVVRGNIENVSAVVIAIVGAFQGGGTGEVSGAKIAGALDLAARDAEQGTPTRAVLLLETGGVRLQEANLGLAATADVHAAIVALRRYVPVVGVISGMVGCFGGMSIAAALCSYMIMTRQGRLGLNGPQVIESNAGVAEFDASDQQLIWAVDGGEQRFSSALVDALVPDDTEDIRGAVIAAFRSGIPEPHRSSAVTSYVAALSTADVSEQLEPAAARTLLARLKPS
ncbi:MAG: biotin-independent malonate decarboxylase subunit beta [Candidatus Eremiobacteraeota bacterium]|nr:biotin-independent malonate decarboxylase subunit beta [Candidatus Eremiobacteraeota bacterium]